MGAAHLGYDAVSKGDGKVGRMVADRCGCGKGAAEYNFSGTRK